jgi:hypothetical protein
VEPHIADVHSCPVRCRIVEELPDNFNQAWGSYVQSYMLLNTSDDAHWGFGVQPRRRLTLIVLDADGAAQAVLEVMVVARPSAVDAQESAFAHGIYVQGTAALHP